MYSVRARSPGSGSGERGGKVVESAANGGGRRGENGVPNPRGGATQPRRLLHSSFTVGRIDLDEDQLGSDHVLLVDDRNGHVYLWCGQLSTFKHRGYGLEAASALKADNPKGGQVRKGKERRGADADADRRRKEKQEK